MYNSFSRPCTIEEIKIYDRVEETLKDIDDDQYGKYVEIIGELVFNYVPAERPKLYSRAYRLGKKLGYTVEELVTWYCID